MENIYTYHLIPRRSARRRKTQYLKQAPTYLLEENNMTSTSKILIKTILCTAMCWLPAIFLVEGHPYWAAIIAIYEIGIFATVLHKL